MRTTFTVVLPAHNAARTVAAAVSSVLRQTRQDFELVIVDDGSTDRTVAEVQRVARDPRIRVLRQENRGPGAARNLAIAYAAGRYVSFMDADDLWLPRYLEVMGGCLDSDDEGALAYTDAWVLDDATRRIRRTTAMAADAPPEHPPRDPRAFLLRLIRANFIYNAVTVRRSVLDDVGGFDTTLRAAGDYELWLRLVSRGHVAVRAPGILAVYRHRSGAISTNDWLVETSLHEVLRRIAHDPSVEPEARALALARVAAQDRKIAALSEPGVGNAPSRFAQAGGRRRGRLLRFVARQRAWYARPPADVRSAFPDLRAV